MPRTCLFIAVVRCSMWRTVLRVRADSVVGHNEVTEYFVAHISTPAGQNRGSSSIVLGPKRPKLCLIKRGEKSILAV